MIAPIKWEDEFSPTQVESYKLVKLGLMARAHVARVWIAETLGGDLGVQGRDYVRTPLGIFRICMNYNSDNRTEQRAHEESQAVSIHVDDPEEMISFFKAHGLNGESEYEALRLALLEAR